jgi:hypothetical protein
MADKLDIIKGLHDRAWQSFDERRKHEYHFDYVIWAGYVLFIAGALGIGKESPLATTIWGGRYWWNLFLVGIVVVVLIGIAFFHIRWLGGIVKAQRLDMVIADLYASELRKQFDSASGVREGEAGIVKEFEKVAERAKPMLIRHCDKTVFEKSWWRLLWSNTNHRSEACVTILLMIAAIGIIVLYRPS